MILIDKTTHSALQAGTPPQLCSFSSCESLLRTLTTAQPPTPYIHTNPPPNIPPKMFGFVSITRHRHLPSPPSKLTDPVARAKQRKTLDIVTLFHKANSPSSTRVVNLLKQLSADASQAANESSSASAIREPFDLEVSDAAPTSDQLHTILGYVGTSGIPKVVAGASTVTEALRRFNKDNDSFQRPLVCLFSANPFASLAIGSWR